MLGAIALSALRVYSQASPQQLREMAIKATALDTANSNRERNMAYREQVLTRDFDSSGKTRWERAKVHDVLLVDDSPQRMLLEEDGKPVTGEAMKGQQDFLRRVIDIRKGESKSQRDSRIAAFDKKHREYRDAIAELPDAFDFTADGEETIEGRVCQRMRVSPRAGFVPKNRYGKIFTQTEGRLWIDKQTGEWRRAEGTVRETVNLGWVFAQVYKGTTARVEQQPFPQAGWMMSSLWYRGVVRVGLFVHYRREQMASYWDYRPMTDAILEDALKQGYPKGTLRSPGRAK